MLDITIKTTEQTLVSIAPVTSDGLPLVSAPSWTVTAGIGTLVVAADGLSAQLVSSDSSGDTLYTIADTSPGGTASDTVTLHSDLAPPPTQTIVSFGLVQGVVTPKGVVVPPIPPVPGPVPAPALSALSRKGVGPQSGAAMKMS